MDHRLADDAACGGVGLNCPICNTGSPPYPSQTRRRHVSGEWIDEISLAEGTEKEKPRSG
jgi:hypothetical protein